MAQDVYRNQVVRLTDLAVTQEILDGLTFENCLILGPAVVAPMGETVIEGSTFHGTAEGMYWPVSPDRGVVIGAIGLNNCKFTRCRFERVGFAGPPELLDALKGSPVVDD